MNDTDVDFRIENGKLYCDESSVTIKYIAQITDPTEFDSSFITAYASRLAAEIAYAITASQSIARGKWEEYAVKMRTARALDSQEGKPDVRNSNTWITSRQGYAEEVEFTT